MKLVAKRKHNPGRLEVRKFCLTTAAHATTGVALRNMKNTLKITSKGQVTFKKEVLDQLGVRPGDRITVELVGRGRLEVRPAKHGGKIKDFIGCLKKPRTRALSIEEMNRIIRKGWAGEK
jgi:antitoxin PrlF